MNKKWFAFRSFQPRMMVHVDGDPAPVGGTGGTGDQAPTPELDPTPAPTPDPAPEPSELDTLLAGEIVDDPANPDDPFAAVKDNPQFVEMSQAAQSFKAVMEAAGAPNVENLQAQIGDAHTLYAVVEGKANAAALLDQLSVYGPEIQQRIGQEVAQWAIQNGFVKPEGGAPEDPALVELANIKKQLADRESAEQNTKFTQRVDAAKTLVDGEIGKFLESKGLKGNEARYLAAIGSHFAGKEMQMIEAAEKGDFKMLNKALQTAYNAEVKYMQAWFKALKERKQQKADKIPNIAGGGVGKGEVKKLTERPPSDSPDFIDWMLQQANK